MLRAQELKICILSRKLLVIANYFLFLINVTDPTVKVGILK